MAAAQTQAKHAVPGGRQCGQLMTVGRTIYPGFQVLLWHNPEEIFDSALGRGSRFRLTLVEQGTGILSNGSRQRLFCAPALFCANESNRPQLISCQNLQAQALYFHPSVINAAFDFNNVRAHAQGSEWHDQKWLRPFIPSNENWMGLVSLGPSMAARISHLFSLVSRELVLQHDEAWPCRSRSYFLEVLFLLDQLSLSPWTTGQDYFSEDISLMDIGPVLLYLHSHYDKKFSLDELARLFHTNRTTLTRQFHAITGLPVMAYLGRLRIQRAALMLRDTRLSVNEITVQLGFTNPTHFGRAFRKQMGYSPSEYRRRLCWIQH